MSYDCGLTISCDSSAHKNQIHAHQQNMVPCTIVFNVTYINTYT